MSDVILPDGVTQKEPSNIDKLIDSLNNVASEFSDFTKEMDEFIKENTKQNEENNDVEEENIKEQRESFIHISESFKETMSTFGKSSLGHLENVILGPLRLITDPLKELTGKSFSEMFNPFKFKFRGSLSKNKIKKIDPGAAYIVEKLGDEEDDKEAGLLGKIFGKNFASTFSGLMGGMGGIVGKILPALPIAGLIAGIAWAAIDGIRGFFASGKWGVSKISGAMGGLMGGMDSGISGAFKNAGKWALIGAGIGSIVPVVGTIAGGIIGAAIGGILGYFGGERIAKGIDKIGSLLDSVFDFGEIFRLLFAPFTMMFENIKKSFKITDILKDEDMTITEKIGGIIANIGEMAIMGIVGYFGGIFEQVKGIFTLSFMKKGEDAEQGQKSLLNVVAKVNDGIAFFISGAWLLEIISGMFKSFDIDPAKMTKDFIKNADNSIMKFASSMGSHAVSGAKKGSAVPILGTLAGGLLGGLMGLIVEPLQFIGSKITGFNPISFVGSKITEGISRIKRQLGMDDEESVLKKIVNTTKSILWDVIMTPINVIRSAFSYFIDFFSYIGEKTEGKNFFESVGIISKTIVGTVTGKDAEFEKYRKKQAEGFDDEGSGALNDNIKSSLDESKKTNNILQQTLDQNIELSKKIEKNRNNQVNVQNNYSGYSSDQYRLKTN